MAARLLLALCATLASGLSMQSTGERAAGTGAGSRQERHGHSRQERHGRQELEARSGRQELAARTLSAQAMGFFRALESASSHAPVFVPPGDMREGDVRKASLLGLDSSRALKVDSEFQPSAEFQQGAEADLPWGLSSPRTGDSLPIFHYATSSLMDYPKEFEYSLDAGDNIQTFSSAWQDVKLITQVLENITNGFYLDTNAAEGEKDSNTLLLELTGWRGLITEPRLYEFARLWTKMRKAWLFLGCVSPHENGTKIGFDRKGLIDMLSGHKIHAYNIPTFMTEMGGRKTIDFWNLNNGGYEAEVLEETLLKSGTGIEFGVILVRFDGRRTGRGKQSFVQERSKDATEQLIFEILHNASFKYIGGLDAYWVNYIEPRFNYKEAVFVNPKYFEKRGVPIPWKVKSAPPPKLDYPLGNQTWFGWDTWDAGYSRNEEIDKMIAYMKKAKLAAKAKEPSAKAHRVASTKLL